MVQQLCINVVQGFEGSFLEVALELMVVVGVCGCQPEKRLRWLVVLQFGSEFQREVVQEEARCGAIEQQLCRQVLYEGQWKQRQIESPKWTVGGLSRTWLRQR